jgi:uncharacterized repeat protein (TIGR03803 family)
MTNTAQSSETRLHAISIAVALAIVFVAAAVATPPAEAQTFNVLYTFTGGADGRFPFAGLISDAKGNLYGTTLNGGSSACSDGCGVVFMVDETGSEKVLHHFTGTKGDGACPYAGLVRDAKANLYGTTYYGGSGKCYDGYGYGCGTVFKVDKAGKETVLHSFTESGGDGTYPQTGLIQDAAGNLYGATYQGGASSYGTVFMLDKTGKETVLYGFSGSPDGAGPVDFGYLVRDANGSLYGTTAEGGASDVGTVFKLDKAGKETVLYSFTGTGGDGSYPIAGLLRDAAGNLHGTTETGGASGDGTVFMLDKTGKETVLYSFLGTGFADGAEPEAGLARDSKGNLYGTTSAGGSSGFGTVFKVGKNGKETVLHSFAYFDGAVPFAGLLRDANGNLYGTTEYGGTYGGGPYGKGTVFELIP